MVGSNHQGQLQWEPGALQQAHVDCLVQPWTHMSAADACGDETLEVRPELWLLLLDDSTDLPSSALASRGKPVMQPACRCMHGSRQHNARSPGWLLQAQHPDEELQHAGLQCC